MALVQFLLSYLSLIMYKRKTIQYNDMAVVTIVTLLHCYQVVIKEEQIDKQEIISLGCKVLGVFNPNLN